MQNEKELLRKELESIDASDEEGLEKLKADAELLGHEDVAELAQQKINAINEQVQHMGSTTAQAIEQVESMGGDSAELKEKLEPVQQEAEKINEQIVQEIKGSIKSEESLEKQDSIDPTGELLEYWKNKMKKLEDNYHSLEWRSKKVYVPPYGEGTNEDFYHRYKNKIQESIDFYSKKE